MSGKSTIRRVGIATKKQSREAARVAGELTEWLHRREITVVPLDRHTAETLSIEFGGDKTSTRDLIVVLGGDGTLMSVARTHADGAPLLGVNLGSLGFLTEINRADLYNSMVEILAGRYQLEQRALLDVKLERSKGESVTYNALNDVVVTKSALARIIALRVEINGELMARYRSDGLILSTPTGSTAYNLSAGGPIIHPLLPVVVVTPICPHTLSHRPLVVPDASQVEVTLETRAEEVFLTVDGQVGTELAYRDKILVRSSKKRIRLIRVTGKSFYDGLRSKLRWGH